MGNILRKKRVIVNNSTTSSGGGTDPADKTRITNLENNEYKVIYWEAISTDSGTITKPTGSTILLDSFQQGIDALVETIIGGQPSGISPITSGGAYVTVSSFDASGNYSLSGTPSTTPVALLYVLKIKALDYANLNLDFVVSSEIINSESITNKSVDITTDQASDIKYPSVKAVYDWAVGAFQTVLSKLTSVEINTGTDDVKYATALGLSNSVYNPVPKTLGVIINEDFANLTNFTQTGSAFAASGGSAVVTGGSSLVFTNYIRQTAYGKSDYEKFTMSVDYTIGTISATSFGIALGLRSGGALSATAALAVGFLADSTNSGKIAFYFNNSSTGAVVSTGRMTITAGDITKIIVRRVKSTIYAHWINITTGQTTSAVYQYHVDAAKVNPTIASLLPNAYHHTIYSLGGSATLDNFIVTCDEVMAPDYLITGGSIDSGYNADVVRNRYVDLLSSATTSRFVMIAGQSDVVEDWNLTQILALQPKNIVLSIGGNNVIIPESAAATMAKVATIVSTLQGAGYVLGTTLWLCTARPRLTVDMTSLNDLIRSTYPGQFIELYYPFWSGTSYTMNASFASADGAHPNVFGHKLEAMIYANFFNLKLKYDFDLNNSGINRDEQGNAGFGNNNYNGLYPVDAYSSVGSQIRFGNTYSSSDRSGGVLTSVVASQALMAGGSYYRVSGATQVATATSSSAVQCFGGDVSFFGKTGLTAGNTFVYDTLATLKATGRLGIGTVSLPTASIHLPANTTAASTAPIKTNAGIVNATAENGAVETDANNDLFQTNLSTVRGKVDVIRPLSSAAGTLTLSYQYTLYSFTGTTTTWTLPALAPGGNIVPTGHIFRIKNKGSGVITLNTNAGGNDIYDASAVNTLAIAPGEAITLIHDGTNFSKW